MRCCTIYNLQSYNQDLEQQHISGNKKQGFGSIDSCCSRNKSPY